jgi:polyisoprenoid-binding protein YceI
MNRKLTTLARFSLALTLSAGFAGAAKDKAKAPAATPAVPMQIVPLDIANSRIVWTGKKVTGAHTGTVALKAGQVLVQNGQIAGGEFTVDMTSIKDEDLKDPGMNGKLIGHLKSDAFFDVQKYPASQFKITSMKPLTSSSPGQPTHEITGDLTIKGITKPLTFPATITIADKKATGIANVTVDRTAYDIRYGSGKFFQNLGDKMIDDTFTVQLQLSANL